MGILVPDLSVDKFGILLSNAYVAVAKHAITLTPVPYAANCRVTGSYSTWTSFQARARGKNPVETAGVEAECAPTSVEDMYAALYGRIKDRFPVYVDHLEPLPMPSIVDTLASNDPV